MPTTQVTEIVSSVDTIAGRTDSAGDPVSPDFSAEESRMILTAWSQGILKPEDGWRVVAGAGSTMNVVVGSGSTKTDIAIVAGLVAGQGNYVARLDEVTKTVALDAADVSNPRIDEVYLVIYDNPYDTTSRGLPRLAVRKGDPASTPTAPGPDGSWQAHMLLATVDIPASAPDILAGTITDERTFASLDSPYGGFVPTGVILDFTGSVPPSGFVFPTGQALSRADFARLHTMYAADGYPYGSGDGSTTFNVPDLRQRYVIGRAASGTGSTLGGTFGNINHTHTGPSHTHTGPSHTHSNPTTGSNGSHSHTVSGLTSLSTVNVSVQSGSGATVAGSQHQHGTSGGTPPFHATVSTGATGSHSHSVGNTGSSGTGATGASGTANTGAGNPPTIALNKILKV